MFLWMPFLLSSVLTAFLCLVSSLILLSVRSIPPAFLVVFTVFFYPPPPPLLLTSFLFSYSSSSCWSLISGIFDDILVNFFSVFHVLILYVSFVNLNFLHNYVSLYFKVLCFWLSDLVIVFYTNRNELLPVLELNFQLVIIWFPKKPKNCSRIR